MLIKILTKFSLKTPKNSRFSPKNRRKFGVLCPQNPDFLKKGSPFGPGSPLQSILCYGRSKQNPFNAVFEYKLRFPIKFHGFTYGDLRRVRNFLTIWITLQNKDITSKIRDKRSNCNRNKIYFATQFLHFSTR